MYMAQMAAQEQKYRVFQGVEHSIFHSPDFFWAYLYKKMFLQQSCEKLRADKLLTLILWSRGRIFLSSMRNTCNSAQSLTGLIIGSLMLHKAWLDLNMVTSVQHFLFKMKLCTDWKPEFFIPRRNAAALQGVGVKCPVSAAEVVRRLCAGCLQEVKFQQKQDV